MLIVTAAQFYSNGVKQFVASRTITFYSKEPLSLYETLLSFFALGLWLGVLEGFAYLQHQLSVLWGSNDCTRTDYLRQITITKVLIVPMQQQVIFYL